MARPKKCKVCEVEFVPVSSLARVCSVPCALVDIKVAKERVFKIETRRRRLAIKTHGKWVQEVQSDFNKFIRVRDTGLPCISCGTTSGQMQAGHYKPAGSHPELRFTEFNCHAQCATCNNHKSGNLTEYRIGLINRIGLPLVEFLEGPHKALKPTIDELKFLKKYYREQVKLIQRAVQ